MAAPWWWQEAKSTTWVNITVFFGRALVLRLVDTVVESFPIIKLEGARHGHKAGGDGDGMFWSPP
jgi:hypothetical protein